MLLNLFKNNIFELAVARRQRLIESIKAHYQGRKGKIVLIGALDQGHTQFLQESSFYYFTGLQEPGLVLVIDLQGYTTLYVPAHRYDKAKWALVTVDQHSDPSLFHLDEIKPLGEVLKTNELTLLFEQKEVEALMTNLKECLTQHDALFVLAPQHADQYIEQQLFFMRLTHFFTPFAHASLDISPLVSNLRRTKHSDEIESLYKAVEIGILAQRAAAEIIMPEEQECVVQASLEWMITAAGSRPSFPSIVASGKNATILHYVENTATIKDGDMVIVDIGARVSGYCSDLSRTYPARGTFNKRQKELYRIVLEVQRYIEDNAKPGLWLSNKNEPEQSLHHRAQKAFGHYGLDRYFIHNIGHFLGLDVHDVGDPLKPLQEGDVFTIEPGLYIPDEGIGIRIEDDYWMTKGGVVCLSDDLEKDSEAIEALMAQQTFEDLE